MSYYPPTPAEGGYLPIFLLVGAAAGTYNAISTNFITWQTKEVYGKAPDQVSPLTARIFGIYTAAVSMIRLYAAYNITNRPVYDLALAAYSLAFLHFALEAVVYKTVRFGRATLGPCVISITGIAWLLAQRTYYTGV